MAGPAIPGQGGEIRDEAGAQGVQVEVAGQFQDVGRLLHHDRRVAVLDEVVVAVVPAAR